jgi:hypothetical protein
VKSNSSNILENETNVAAMQTTAFSSSSFPQTGNNDDASNSYQIDLRCKEVSIENHRNYLGGPVKNLS